MRDLRVGLEPKVKISAVNVSLEIFLARANRIAEWCEGFRR